VSSTGFRWTSSGPIRSQFCGNSGKDRQRSAEARAETPRKQGISEGWRKTIREGRAIQSCQNSLYFSSLRLILDRFWTSFRTDFVGRNGGNDCTCGERSPTSTVIHMILNQATSHKQDGPSAATSRRTAANERRYTSVSTCRSAGRDSDQAALLNLLRRFGPKHAGDGLTGRPLRVRSGVLCGRKHVRATMFTCTC
jgi:hypothetical protein